LRFPLPIYLQRLLPKNTALSKSQATAAVKGADKSVKVLLRAVAQLNFHTPAESFCGESCRQVAPNRGIFSLAKIREQKGTTTDFVCAVPFLIK
jgi:hypothetical protein